MDWIHVKIKTLIKRNININNADYRKPKCIVEFIPGNINYIFNMKLQYTGYRINNHN